MGLKKIVEEIGETKGRKLLNAGRDLHTFMNVHGSYYAEIRTAAGVPLNQLTDAQINNYFGVTLPANVLTSIKAFLDTFETMMSTMQTKVDALPADDVSNEI